MNRVARGLAALIIIVALAGSSAAHAQSLLSGTDESLLGTLTERLSTALAAITIIGQALPGIPAALGTAAQVILAPEARLPTAIILALLALAIPALVQRLGGQRLERWLDQGSPSLQVIRRFGADLAGLALMVVITGILTHRLIGDFSPAVHFSFALIGTSLRWCVTMTGMAALLRPRHPAVRLLAVDDQTARMVLRWAGVTAMVGIGFFALAPALTRAGVPRAEMQGLALIIGTVTYLLAVLTARRLFAGLPPYPGRRHAVQGLLLFFCLIWLYSVVMVDFGLFRGLSIILGLIAGALVIDSLLGFIISDLATRSRILPLLAAARRAVRATAAGGLLIFIGRIVAVDLLGLTTPAEWQALHLAVTNALIVLILGYVLFEVLRGWVRSRLGQNAGSAPGHPDDDGGFHPASRLASVLPLLEAVAGVLIITAAVLIALDRLGINTAPLLAGAGIFGLAISFGSQALVKDIVSGIFYVFDDAFRVGEYIVAGSHKGTVEKLALRSLRVRHQNGQIHTIPYGQLGAVTNFSRDWTTLKFNLRLARDTDLEKARKLVKKIGVEMLSHPELGPELIAPLKMQGVIDVVENAVICRFKFTVRPGKPTLVQREAIKRIFQVFAENDVKFASNAVTIQGNQPSPADTAAAAAATTLDQPPGLF